MIPSSLIDAEAKPKIDEEEKKNEV